MPSETQLNLAGYRGEPVPNTMIRQDERATQVAVFLPGFGYTCGMPLFYYAGLLLFARGLDLLRVDYEYNRVPGFRELPASERRDWLLADARAAIHAVSEQHQYQQLILVGKSVSTLTMGYLLTAEPLRPAVRAVWLTPLLRDATLRQQLQHIAVPSLTLIGAADPEYDAAYLQELEQSLGHTLAVIPDGDHSLDIGLDAVASIRAVEHVLTALATFLQ
jgi:dienelactone hydrolase